MYSHPKSLCGDQIYNILEEYESQISSDSETEAEFDSSDSGSGHVDDNALGEVTVSETDIEGEIKVLKIFCGKIWAIMLDKEQLFVMFLDHKVVQRM
jgi:hypothetical protein